MRKDLLLNTSSSARKLAFLVLSSLALAPVGRAQSVRAQTTTGESSRAFQANATIADQAPTIDGKDDDAVWDAATRIDSLGWTAEFRIPLSQVRYPRAAEHTFGIMIMRDITRRSERDSWPVYRRSKSGIASQFGDLVGLRGLGSPHRLEVAPYVIAKNSSVSQTTGFGRTQKQTVGG